MTPKWFISGIALPALILASVWMTGCGPRPPIPYQQLQVQDMELAEGYDVYLYVAVRHGHSAEEIEALLRWFDEIKYPYVNKMAVYVWDNPQAALVGAMGDMVGSLRVDRQAGVFELDTGGGRR